MHSTKWHKLMPRVALEGLIQKGQVLKSSKSVYTTTQAKNSTSKVSRRILWSPIFKSLNKKIIRDMRYSTLRTIGNYAQMKLESRYHINIFVYPVMMRNVQRE